MLRVLVSWVTLAFSSFTTALDDLFLGEKVTSLNATSFWKGNSERSDGLHCTLLCVRGIAFTVMKIEPGKGTFLSSDHQENSCQHWETKRKLSEKDLTKLAFSPLFFLSLSLSVSCLFLFFLGAFPCLPFVQSYANHSRHRVPASTVVPMRIIFPARLSVSNTRAGALTHRKRNRKAGRGGKKRIRQANWLTDKTLPLCCKGFSFYSVCRWLHLTPVWRVAKLTSCRPWVNHLDLELASKPTLLDATSGSCSIIATVKVNWKRMMHQEMWSQESDGKKREDGKNNTLITWDGWTNSMQLTKRERETEQ